MHAFRFGQPGAVFLDLFGVLGGFRTRLAVDESLYGGDLLLGLADPCLGAGEPLAQLLSLPFRAFVLTGDFCAELDQSFLMARQFFGVAVQTLAVLFEAVAEIGAARPALAVDVLPGAAAFEVAGRARQFFLLASQPPFGPLDFAGQALFGGKHAIKAWFGGGGACRAKQREGEGGHKDSNEGSVKASAGNHRILTPKT